LPGHRIYVTRALPEAALAPLRAASDVALLEVNGEDRPLSRRELEAALADKDGAIVLLMDRVDDALLALCPRLRAIGCFSVGTDNVDLAACARRGVAVTNTPLVLTDATADMTFALLLAVARRLVEGDRIVREGRFPGWAPLFHLGLDVTGRTLGLVGGGRIAHAVARRAKGFSMRVLYAARSRKPALEEAGAALCDRERLLAESDFVSVHVALVPETRHIIDEAALRRMKKTAVLINTTRGPTVDERALVRALSEGWIAGAGLDVFEEEPALAPGLALLPNVVLAPHTGSATHGTRTAMGLLAATGVLALLRGEKPAHWVPGSAWPPRSGPALPP
jgi:glyoxylate reductase